MAFNVAGLAILAAFIETGWTLNDTLSLNSEATQLEEGKQLATGFGSIQYTNFVINEYSYKFWAVFQLITLGILLYSVIAAVYYSKWTFLQEVESPDYDADLLFRRSLSDRPRFNSRPLAKLLQSLHHLPDFVGKIDSGIARPSEDDDFDDP